METDEMNSERAEEHIRQAEVCEAGDHVRHYAANPTMTSLVSYPKRCQLWGSSSYRGNCDGTLFKDLVLRYGARRIADPMRGSRTTEHVVAGLNRYCSQSISYWGGDLREGFNLLRQDLPGLFDFIWAHPPYWTIVRYGDHPDDLSNIADYRTFLVALKLCLNRCYAALVPGGRLAVLVGDIRRQGTYTPLGRDVMCMAGTLGDLVSVIIKTQHNCQSDAKAYGRMTEVPIKHEYCIVFQRPRRAAA